MKSRRLENLHILSILTRLTRVNSNRSPLFRSTPPEPPPRGVKTQSSASANPVFLSPPPCRLEAELTLSLMERLAGDPLWSCEALQTLPGPCGNSVSSSSFSSFFSVKLLIKYFTASSHVSSDGQAVDACSNVAMATQPVSIATVKIT